MTTLFTISPDVCSSSDKDGTTILDIAHDKIYSVIGVGSLIWAKLVASGSGVPFDIIVQDLSEQFTDVPGKQIERDVEDLLESFRRKGLIRDGNASDYFAHPVQQLVTCYLTKLARAVTALLLRLRLNTIAAFLGLAGINLILKAFGFHLLCRTVKAWSVTNRSTFAATEQEICQAIDKATTWYPKQAMCLQRSAVTTCLLRHSGIPAKMIIGCRKIPFKAHAWVEVDGQIVNDKKQVQEYYSVLDRC